MNYQDLLTATRILSSIPLHSEAGKPSVDLAAEVLKMRIDYTAEAEKYGTFEQSVIKSLREQYNLDELESKIETDGEDATDELKNEHKQALATIQNAFATTISKKLNEEVATPLEKMDKEKFKELISFLLNFKEITIKDQRSGEQILSVADFLTMTARYVVS